MTDILIPTTDLLRRCVEDTETVLDRIDQMLIPVGQRMPAAAESQARTAFAALQMALVAVEDVATCVVINGTRSALVRGLVELPPPSTAKRTQ